MLAIFREIHQVQGFIDFDRGKFGLMLLGVAIVAVGFTGYHGGLTQTRPRFGTPIMAVMVAVVIVGVIDLDQPARGLIQVPNQSLVDVSKDIQR